MPSSDTDSEFQITSHTKNGHTIIYSPPRPSKKQRSLVSASSSKISALFLPGGSLDSQTTETQWYNAHFDSNGSEYDSKGSDSETLSVSGHDFLTISQHHHPKSELLKPFSSPPTTPMDVLPPAPVLKPIPTGCAELEDLLHQEIQKCVYDLIVACGEAGKNGVKAVREELETELEAMKRELDAVMARRDLLHNELVQERRWITVLEQALRKNNVLFPDYPF